MKASARVQPRRKAVTVRLLALVYEVGSKVRRAIYKLPTSSVRVDAHRDSPLARDFKSRCAWGVSRRLETKVSDCRGLGNTGGRLAALRVLLYCMFTACF